jgi:hypothetical protein
VLINTIILIFRVCSSFQTGTKLLSDTNVAVITSTIATGHFDLEATVIQQNNTGRDELTRRLPTRKENVIHLGHTQNKLNVIQKLLNPPKLKSLSEKLSTNTSDGLINEGESVDPDYYEDYSNVDSNEDFNNENGKLSKPNDHIFTLVHSRLNKEKNNPWAHKVDQFNHPKNIQLHHQMNGQSLQEENQLSHLLDILFLQENIEEYHPVSNQMTHQQNNLSSQLTGHHLLNNQPNLELNQAINQLKKNTVNQQTLKDLIRNEFAKQNIQLHQPLNNPVENLFSLQHNSLSSQPANHQTGNQFIQQNGPLNEPVNHSKGNQQNVKLDPAENQQQNGQMTHTIDNTLANQLIHQQNEHLNQPINHLVGNDINKHQNDHTYKPTNQFNNPMRSEFTYQLNQPQNQLLSHIINQLRGTQNFVHQPKQLHQGARDHVIQQADQTNQLVNEIYQLKLQKKNPSNKPDNFEQNYQMKQLINLLNPTAENQVQGQQNVPPSELANYMVHPTRTQLSQQNVQISPLATQSIHPASTQLIQQENDKSRQFVDRFHSFIHPQYTPFSPPIGHLIHTANNQAIQQKNDQLKIPMDVIINSESNHFSDAGKSNKIENNLMHLIYNQITDQKTDQTNQYANKLIHPPNNNTDDYQQISSHPSTYQFSDNDKFQEYQKKATNPALNIIFDQSNTLKGVPPENIMLPVINQFNNILGNQTTYRENSKFTNNKYLFPHITENKIVSHEPSQNKDDINVIKTSTKLNVTKIFVRNTDPYSIHKPFTFGNNTITLFPDPDLKFKA